MIKLLLPETKISDLTPEQLEQLDYASLTKVDLADAPITFLKNSFAKLSTNLMRSILLEQRIEGSHLSSEDWVTVLDKVNGYYVNAFNVFDHVQLPHNVVRHYINDRSNNVYHHVRNQLCLPIEEIVTNAHSSTIIEMLSEGNKNLLDYINTNEGATKVRSALTSTRVHLRYVKSTEAAALGLTLRNHRLSVELLRRVGACSDGQRYAARVLKELGVDSIMWDDLVELIRTDKKYKKRSSFNQYMSWVVSNRNDLVRASD